MNRRDLIKAAAISAALPASHLYPFGDFHKASGLSRELIGLKTQERDEPEKGERPFQDPAVAVVNPRNKVPLSFIIDDSTCLVNLAHYCIPQFAEVFPDRYKQDWRKLPREIPDDFVRKFADWCGERKIKGKYSIVPYPACVGWVDRDLPGWSKKELEDSIKLVNERLVPDWDIHPEMISHTWAIDTKTGRPYEDRTQNNMENWGFSVGKSPDEMTDYLAYALQILKNAGFACEGVTTPGGFGNRSRKSLSIGTLRACRQVYKAEIPHYFRHLYTDQRSVAPRVENAKNLTEQNPECVVSIIGCTGDWFGGWDGLTPGDVDRLITADLKSGRMVEVIERGEPAIMVCHWPGIYYNGEELGFKIFQQAVTRIHKRFQNVQWMNLSEISRYWAAKELTEMRIENGQLHLQAPFSSPNFTLSVKGHRPLFVQTDKGERRFFKPGKPDQLAAGQFFANKSDSTICFDLEKGKSTIGLSRL